MSLKPFSICLLETLPLAEFSPLRAVLFLFFFNRLFASLVSYGIRAYTWHRHRVYVDVQALQFSPLAGRIFFKGLRYHGHNETILVHDGHITWRYWLRRVQGLDFQRSDTAPKTNGPFDGGSSDDDGARQNESNGDSEEEVHPSRLPCRVLVTSRGVEWFIYNRSPAYDAIFESMHGGKAFDDANANPMGQSETDANRETSAPIQNSSAQSFDQDEKGDSLEETTVDDGLSNISTESSARPSARTPDQHPSTLPSLLNILPVQIECNRGAIVMGNQNTRSIFTAKFDNAAGQIGARRSRPVDQYKQMIDFEFVHPVIQFKHNKDYKDTQVSEGVNLVSEDGQRPETQTRWLDVFDFRKRIRAAWGSVREFAPYHRASVESLAHPRPRSSGNHHTMGDNAGAYGQNRWLGLTRYLDDDDDLLEQERWKAIEYAEFPTIVDSPGIGMSFYWDVPGVVPGLPDSTRKPPRGCEADMNRDAPPDWGIELKIRGGTISYGPWADRQRADLQGVFFPTSYKDAIPATQLLPGQSRISTMLKVVIEIEEQTTILVPTREDSKDWRWKGRTASSAATQTEKKKTKTHIKLKKGAKVNQTPEPRPFGWLEVRVSPNSTVSFTVDLVVGAEGYKNSVYLDLKGLEMSSSVNHGLLWRSKSQVISCDLSNPLGWNSLRRWHIDIQDNGLELFILRDHLFLLTDLINDWTSGPPGNFHTFVPFEYSISLNFADFKLYLNANDSNIVSNPSDLDDNTFIIIWGQVLKIHLSIPSKTFRPARNQVKFDAEAQDGGFELRTPSRNTQHTFMDSSDVAMLKDIRIDGSYSFYTTASPNLTDVLLLNVFGSLLKIDLYGFLIKYLMKIKDNYFGDDMHFRTLEEYQDQITRPEGRNPQDHSAEQHSRLSNDLDVILGITAENSSAALPAHLYSAAEDVRLEILSVMADLRITNYYMDLAISSSPIVISHASNNLDPEGKPGGDFSTQIFVDCLELCGHRLFGLPPAEPTYVCNWDFSVGRILGECSIEFVHCLAMAIKCFKLSFDDAENALPSLNPSVIHDMTFLRAKLQPVLIGLRVEQAAFLLSTREVKVNYNDWAGPLFSDRLHMLVPDLTVAVVDSRGALASRSSLQHAAKTHAYVKVSIDLKKVRRKLDFKADRQLQQGHVMLHDTRTHRIPWLIHIPDPANLLGSFTRPVKRRQPAMPFPPMPEPVSTVCDPANDKSTQATRSTESTHSITASARKSSFLAENLLRRGKRRNYGDGVAPTSATTWTDCTRHKPKSTESWIPAEHQLPTYSSPPPPCQDSHDLHNKYPGIQSIECLTNFAFSSPYKRPNFPLLATWLEIRDVPELPGDLPSDFVLEDISTLEDLEFEVLDKNTKQSSFMVNVCQGVQAFCSSEALVLVSQLLARFQTDDAVTLLDNLQIDAMTDVLRADGELDRGSQITEARIYTPRVRASFVNATESESKMATQQERYELTLENIAATLRSSEMIPEDSPSRVDHQFSTHILLDQLNCSGKESARDKTDDQAIVSLTVYEPLLWMSRGTFTSAEMQCKGFEIVSASRKVDYISSLIRRSVVLSEDLARRFSKIEHERKSRLRLLVLLLTIEGEDIPDAPFLTRASYVLRSAAHHLRTSDSWKLMSRLRYIYRSLPARSRNSLYAQCVREWASCPQDAGSRVVASFDHWRAWDLAHVRSSLLMQKVYGQLLYPPTQVQNAPEPFKASIRMGTVRVFVEPGPNQNETSIENLSIGLAMNQASLPRNASLAGTASIATISTIQVHCVKTVVRLNWSLFDVLENIVETVRATRIPTSNSTSSHHVTGSSLDEKCLHIAASSEMSILNFDSINLKSIVVCQGLKTSIVSLQTGFSSQQSSLSIVVNADAATSEVRRRSTTLTLYKLRGPSVFGSRDSNLEEGIEKPWRFVGSGREVSFRILADPLELVEVANRFLVYEVAHLNTWVKSLQPSSSPTLSSVATSGRRSLLKAHMALFLDSYLVSMAVLPSLTYQITGTGARTSIKSGLRGDYEVAVDFDLKVHSHVFKTQADKDSDELSTLQMPPVNGRVRLDLAPKQKSVVFHTLVECVAFDASAVHAILTTTSRPEIASLVESIRQEATSIQDHYEHIFEVKRSESKSLSSAPLLYTAHITLESLAIHASTPESTSVTQGAKLRFDMGRIQLKTTNRDKNYEAAMKLSELEVQLKGINLNLWSFENLKLHPCGDIAIELSLRCTSKSNGSGELVRSYQVRSSSLEINVYTETASVVVAILGHLQDTLKTIDLSHEVNTLRRLRHARLQSQGSFPETIKESQPRKDVESTALFKAMYALEMTNIRARWRVGNSIHVSPAREAEDLILSFKKIDLATQKDNAARLLIEDFQLQMVPASNASTGRSLNSALLPEVVFNVAYLSTVQDRRLAFQAAGKSLDLRLTSQFILPASDLRRSIALSTQQLRRATASWYASATVTEGQSKRLLGNKKLASLLVDADFAGAVVYIQGRSVVDTHQLALNVIRGGRLPQHGRYNQFTPENASSSNTTLRAPGIAFKVEYKNVVPDEQSLNAEVKVDGSTNSLYPTVVPLIMEISSSIKEIVGEPDEKERPTESKLPQPKFLGDERLRTADPSAIFGNCRLNLGLRICKQEFSLSCQPIARVTATARFEDIYLTVNTVQSQEHGKFFAVSAAFTRLQASVQHVYSRESTGSFDVDSIVVSLMNSKHVSSANGISAILNISPMKAQINAKQSQDFLLFREIWVPPEIRQSSSAPVPVPASESQAFIVQRYQQVAAAGAFPWNATVSIAELDVQLDLGQSLGKSAFMISGFWVSSKKTSDWEQNLCLGFKNMSVNSTGRMSGFVELQEFRVRTSIQWPIVQKAHNQTPLVQASLAFDHLRVKAAFDYQAFLVADINTFEFLMYNVRDLQHIGRDRLVGVLDGDKVQVFSITTSASQALALYQAFQRLIQEKQAAYEASIRDIEKFLRRKSSVNPLALRAAAKRQADTSQEGTRSSLRLQTDVVVTLKVINLGVFPNTFFDNQIFKLEALDASARFAVVLEREKIHSTLSMTLGQLRIALASVTRANVPKTLGEVSVNDVVASATGSRGGTILKVPKVVATMQTWQTPESAQIDYLFKSSFQGKVDVGWNYSRISYIRGMWTSHARALAQRLGKPLPQSALQITGGPQPEGEYGSQRPPEGGQEKITAVVNVPQSKYQYTALQPAVIETPQLRDMGEATPPLEWIGLHRDRLPNLTHQIVIVTLLEVAKEVDDAYSRILGSS